MDRNSTAAARVGRKLDTFMRFAKDLGALSTCQRSSVGALITDPEFAEVYSIGYNGPASGFDDCSNKVGRCGCVHAEANAVVKLKSQAHGLIMLSTTAPCFQCASLIINRRQIIAVVWLHPYRNTAGLVRLHNAGILEYRYDENVIEWWLTYRKRWRAARSGW